MTLKLLFVGDGPRDEAAVPRLVERVLGEQVEEQFEAWKQLHLRGSGRGLDRKLRYALRQAKDRNLAGVVATVDSDRRGPSDKVSELVQARQSERDSGNAMPVGIGEAIPHLEAWLLDDPVSVKLALNLPKDRELPAVSKIADPKAALNELWSKCPTSNRIHDCLAEIARGLEYARCIHASTTGFEAFVKDVRSEFAEFPSR